MMPFTFSREYWAMLESNGTAPFEPRALPHDGETRRLAIATLAYRAIGQKREVQLNDMLGPEGADLLSDLMATLTNETSTQLMLTERLLALGWTWQAILEAVWYNEDVLRAAAIAE
jgi:hypothetical protein